MRNRVIVRWLAAGVLLTMCGCIGKSGSSSTDNSGSGSESSGGSSSLFKPAPPPPVVIPADTAITVTLDQSISTQTNQTGDSFAASLAEPLTLEGREILRTGTKAQGTVVQAQSAGHLKGSAILALTLDSITVKGQKYSIETTQFEEAGKGRGKRTAIGAGGGAAFGAIVGALAGGGKGAAIGALAGGGAGTAGAAYTGKRDFSLPAETRLHFKLSKPLTINP